MESGVEGKVSGEGGQWGRGGGREDRGREKKVGERN